MNGRVAIAVALRSALGAAMLTACRAIIGVDSVTLTEAARDASVDATTKSTDAGHITTLACPTADPKTLFSVPAALTNPFVAGDSAFAELFGLADQFVPGPFSGFVVCPKSGCTTDGPTTVANYLSIDGGVTYGFATAVDAGAYYSVPNGTLDNVPNDASTGSIRAAALDGGGLRPVVENLHYPFLVAVAPGDIYWTDDPTTITAANDEYAWELWHAKSDGSGATRFFKGAVGNTIALLADATNVYTLAQDSAGNLGLFVCARSGCSGNAVEAVSNIAFSSDQNDQNEVDSFVSDDTTLFHAAFESGTISRSTLDGHDASVIVSGQKGPWNLLVDATSLYWLTTDGDVYSARKDGTGSITPLACGLTNITGLAVDEARVYVLATDPKNVANTAMISVPIVTP